MLLSRKLMTTRPLFFLGLSYLNRYYGVKFDDVNLKQLMLFKPDFYGKNVDVLDRLIEIGSKEDYIKGTRTHDAFREVVAKILALEISMISCNTTWNSFTKRDRLERLVHQSNQRQCLYCRA